MLDRNLERRVKECLACFPVVVLVGVRQCGKTTLARKVKPKWRYFDLEKGSDRDLITGDFDFFFKQYPSHLIIDEAQTCPDLFRELRSVIDTDRSQKNRFLLTGSSSPDLAKNIAESLAGRVAVLEVGTLKMNERYRIPLSPIYEVWHEVPAKDHIRAIEGLSVPLNSPQVLHHFFRGGYPEPSVEDNESFYNEWMTQYQQAYIHRDIRRLFPGLNGENYRRFITMLSELSGTIINRSEIGRTLGISESAVRDYLDIAQGTFIWRTLSSLEHTVSKSVVKMPRGYLRDSGLLHHQARIFQFDHIFTRPGTGSAFEGFVIEEIIQGIQARAKIPWGFHFYRTRGGAEIDLVLTTTSGSRIPLEIKFGSTARRGDLRALTGFIEQERCPYGVIVNNAEEIRLLTENILQIPAGCL